MAVRLSQSAIEVAEVGSPKGRFSQSAIEVAEVGSPKGRFSQSAVEVAFDYTAPVTLGGGAAVIASAESFGVGTVTLAATAQDLTDGTTIASAEAFGTGVVAGPLTGVSPIASAESFGAGSVTATYQVVGGVLSIPSAEEFPLGVVAGPVTGASPIASGEFFFPGLLSYDQSLTGSTIASAEDFDIGTVAQQLSGNTIASLESFGAGTLAFGIAGYDTIPSGELFLPGGMVAGERDVALYIRGIDRSAWLKRGTMEIAEELDGRCSASFMIDTSGHRSRLVYRPSPYDEVIYMFGGFRRFGGFVQDYDETALDGRADLRIHVTCTDYRQLAEDRIFSKVYRGPAFSFRTVIGDIFRATLAQENIRWNEAECEDLTVTGVAASRMRFPDVPASEALTRACAYFGASWRITRTRELKAQRATWDNAPRTLRDNDGAWRNMHVKRSSRLNRTRQGIRTGLPVAGQRETTIAGNGTHEYTLSHPITGKPAVLVNTVEQAVIHWDNRTLQPYDFAYEDNSGLLRHNAAQAVYTTSDELVITHPSAALDVYYLDDSAAQARLAKRTGGSGIVEVIRTAQEIRDKSSARQMASTEMELKGASAEGLSWEEDELLPSHQNFKGPRPWEVGQVVLVFVTAPMVCGMFVVTNVRLQDVDGCFLRYNITATSRELPMITAVEVDPEQGTITITVDRPVLIDPGSGISIWGAGGIDPLWGGTPTGPGGIDSVVNNTLTFRLPPQVDPGDLAYTGGIGGVNLPARTGPLDDVRLGTNGFDGGGDPFGGYIFSGIPPTGGPHPVDGGGIGTPAGVIVNVNKSTNEVTMAAAHGWSTSYPAGSFRVRIFGVRGCDAPSGSTINNPFTRITVTAPTTFIAEDVGDISTAEGFVNDGMGRAIDSGQTSRVTPGVSVTDGLNHFLSQGTYLEGNDTDRATFILAAAIPGVASRPLATGQAMTNAWEAQRDVAVVTDVTGRFETPPLGLPVLIDIKKNGVTIFAASNPLTIPDGNDSVVRVSTFNENPLMVTQGDKFTIDVNQVGSEFPGCGGTVHVNMRA